MIRKLLMVAAAAAVPLGVIAAGAVGGGVAGAATPITVTPVTCHESGTVNFMAPGISLSGNATTSHTTTTTSSTTVRLLQWRHRHRWRFARHRRQEHQVHGEHQPAPGLCEGPVRR